MLIAKGIIFRDEAYPGFILILGDKHYNDMEEYYEVYGEHSDGRSLEGYAYPIYRNSEWQIDFECSKEPNS